MKTPPLFSRVWRTRGVIARDSTDNLKRSDEDAHKKYNVGQKVDIFKSEAWHPGTVTEIKDAYLSVKFDTFKYCCCRTTIKIEGASLRMRDP